MKETLAIHHDFREKRDRFHSRLERLGVRIDRAPDGTFYVWGNLAGLPAPLNDGMGFFRAALEQKVITVPGEFFDVNPGKRRAPRLALPQLRALLLRSLDGDLGEGPEPARGARHAAHPPMSGSPSTSRHVLIAGAGIGGLTLACALRRAGLAVTVFERAEVLRPVGAGITVQMNAMSALRSLGLAEAVAREGAALGSAALLQHTGGVLTRTSLDTIAREFGGPAIGIHRGRLQAVLLAGLSEEHVRTGLAVRGVHEEGSQVTVELSDGSRATGDVLVGADGLHSVVRRAVLGDSPLRYSGYTSWRGVARLDAQVNAGGVTETWGPGARFGIVPIGHGETYWFATQNAPAGEKDAPGHARARLLERFGGWHAPIARLLEATAEEHILRTDIQDQPPVKHWSRGRVTLLGDAAHPMTPNMGQGGGQAIEDAVVLARCLLQEAEVSAALAAYEHRRVERANGFVSRSYQLGRVAQWESAAGRAVRDALMRLTPTSAATRQLRAIMRFEP